MEDKKRGIDFFDALLDSDNAAELLDEQELDEVAKKVVSEYESDKMSMSDWLNSSKEVIDLARMVCENKDIPWEGAANVKFPIITRAVTQWASNAASEIIRQGKAVEVSVIGNDPEGIKQSRANRVKDYMNYQLLIKNTDWQDSMDRTLRLLAVVGTVFRKTYFDPVTGENCSQLCLHDEVFVNNRIESLKKARRVTHFKRLHSNEIVENIRLGIFSKVDEDVLNVDSEDTDSQIHEILEQHRYLDLDGDGYAEPYIVTVLKEQNKILRIFPRFEREDIRRNDKGQIRYIKPCNYFVDYHCIPSVDGSFFSTGFGALLHTINNAVNTGINQLIDAGTLANTQTGFISKGLKIPSKDFKLGPGQFHKVDTPIDGGNIGNGIHMLQFKEPSAVLFQMMGLLDQAAKELSTTTDVMTGNQLAQNAPATSVLTLVERGMKVYNDIQKRLFRALSNEYQSLYELNRKYLDPIEYLTVLDDPEASPEDFENKSFNIQTIANPELASDAQRLAQAQLLYSLINLPGMQVPAIIKTYLEAGNIKNVEQYMDPNMGNPADSAQAMQEAMAQQEAQLKEREQALKEFEAQLKARKQQFDELIKTEKVRQTDEKQEAQVNQIVLDSVNHNKEMDIKTTEIAANAATQIKVAEIASEAKRDSNKGRD